MTIGVPICHEWETCGEVLQRLSAENTQADAVVVLDGDGAACGWLSRTQLAAQGDATCVSEVMHEAIPTIPPDIPAEVAAQLMRDQGVEHFFLMHGWPGEARPAAIISLAALEQRLAAATD